MKILIVGCGRVGARLAVHMQRESHQVAVIDNEREAFNRLGGDFNGRTIQGNGTETDVLMRAVPAGADVLFALTGGDNRNLMIAQLARHRLGIQRVVARLHDPVRASRFRELGVQTLCTTTLVEGLLSLYAEGGDFPALPQGVSVEGDNSAIRSVNATF